MISFEYKSSGKTEKALTRMQRREMFNKLSPLAQKGVAALRAATPVDEGVTAASWDYKITQTRGGVTITWTNSHENNGVPIAIILQYGHGTGTGGWVAGRNYINPAIQPIFDEISESAWKEVTSA